VLRWRVDAQNRIGPPKQPGDARGCRRHGGRGNGGDGGDFQVFTGFVDEAGAVLLSREPQRVGAPSVPT